MTLKANPDNQFIRFGGFKLEAAPELARKFKEVCKHLKVNRTVVLRQLVSDFIEEVESQTKERFSGKTSERI